MMKKAARKKATNKATKKAAKKATKAPANKTKRNMAPAPPGVSAAKMIDGRIRELKDWRGKTLAQVRALIRSADPDVVEEWKWGIPVWSHEGILCTGETYQKVVKLTFAKGASLDDPSGLFNSSLGGGTRRAIDIPEDAKINEPALKKLIRAAVTHNLSKRG